MTRSEHQLPEQHPAEAVATSLARIEGKFDVFTERLSNMAVGLQDLKEALRSGTEAGQQALHDHITDINPHPGMELWLRDAYKAIADKADTEIRSLQERVQTLEADRYSRGRMLAAVAFMVTTGIAIVAVIISAMG